MSILSRSSRATSGCSILKLSPITISLRATVSPAVRCYHVETTRDRVSGIWYVPNGINTDHKSVVRGLPQLLASKRQNLTQAVFLATPSVAHWFSPGHEFLKQAVNHIYHPLIPKAAPTTIVAIIDALPSPSTIKEGQSNSDIFRGAEGFALCLLPESEAASISPASELQNELPVVHFKSLLGQGADGKHYIASASLQVANTLFVNGSKSTLFRNQWEATTSAQGSQWQLSGAIQPLKQLAIPIEKQARHFLNINDHLRLITSPKAIVSSMGNVVRELQNDDGNSMKASTELEKLVPEFLKEQEAKYGPGRVEVYALLMPPPKIVEESQSTPVATEQQSSSLTDLNRRPSTASLIYQALWRGGRLHKVTGGGGGWGKKAGLLSLDTSTNFDATSKFEISMFSSFRDEDNKAAQPSVAEEAIPTGWSIQFLATFVGPEMDPYEAFYQGKLEDVETWTPQRWTWNSKKQSVAIGITDPKDEHVVSDSQQLETSPRITAIPSAFGMLSANGMCLSLQPVDASNEASADTSSQTRTAHEFRFDVPQTTFHFAWRPPKFLKDYSELEEVPVFESANVQQAKILGPMMQDALRISRKPSFRKIPFHPNSKSGPPLRTEGIKTAKKDSVIQSEPKGLSFKIRKHVARGGFPGERVMSPGATAGQKAS